MKTVLVTAPTILPVSLSEAKQHLRVTGSDDDRLIKRLLTVAVASTEQYLCRKLITQTWKMYLDEWPSEIKVAFGDLQSVTHVKYTDSAGTQSTFSTDYYDADTVSVPGRVMLEYGESWPTDTLAPTNPIEVQFVTGYTYSDDVQEAVMDGSGLDDLTSGGTYTGTSPALFEVRIQSAATPDTIKWRKNGGTWTTGVAITGAAQTLSDGVTVTFAATTGHTAADRWEFFAGSTVPEDVKNGILMLLGHLYENRETTITGVGTIIAAVPKAFEYLCGPHRVIWWALGNEQ